ncbi:hypothetical protein L798_07389 [Zootermopsis nevadensis]|uniref:Uncharacterized protein n=1 Tax=Zootermopsis nevadensis TaxID=136037 RepID=A0A067R642_ZOONE|nr:hypothetical protein L798_07389 [Zootermopsis nevadensis]
MTRLVPENINNFRVSRVPQIIHSNRKTNHRQAMEQKQSTINRVKHEEFFGNKNTII